MPRHRSFLTRNCWICGKELSSMDKCDFLPSSFGIGNEDYNGFCKAHNINEILKKKGRIYELIKVKDRKMRRLIINLFLIGLFIEILIYLPPVIHFITK